MNGESGRRNELGIAAFVGLGLLIHGLLAFHAAWHDSVTIDEFGHLPAGISYWQTGTFSAYRVNPPLIRLIATAPAMLLSPELDYAAGGPLDAFALGHQLLRDDPERFFQLLFVSRLPVIALSLFGGWLVYRWSRELFGLVAGLIALWLWCFSPNILAHGHLLTPDVGTAVVAVLATWSFWRYLQVPGWRRACAAGFLLGLAQLSKFSLLVLYPAWLTTWLVCGLVAPEASAGVRGRLRQIALHGPVIAGLSLIVINVGYLCEGTLRPLGEFELQSALLTKPLSGTVENRTPLRINRFRESSLGRLPIPLPENYLLGIDEQKFKCEVPQFCYLRGRTQRGGWWYFYLYALLVKVPVGTWLLGLLAVAALARGVSAGVQAELLLALPPLLLLGLLSSELGFTHHLRYALPCFPFAFIWISRIGQLWDRGSVAGHWRPLLGVFIIASLGSNAVSALRAHPHYLSYFNEFAGGPERGHRHLIDSNIDWGQDLFALRDWVREHPEARGMRVAHFGWVDPSFIGLPSEPPPAGPTLSAALNRAVAEQLGPQPGWYAVSVTLLHGAPWSFGAENPLGSTLENAYSYFQHFDPVDRAGYSIYVYHITFGEANRVRRELGLPDLRAGSERVE